MPWRASSVMSLRQEFIKLLHHESLSFSELCRRYGISRKTGYKWAERFANTGTAGLEDASRRPKTIARHIDQNTADEIVRLRKEHSCWGARKIRRRLQDRDICPVPACSTITRTLHRHGFIDPERPGSKKWQRFEHPAPNCLWQMDFKAPVQTLAGMGHPLTVLDDHSRFNICLRALAYQRTNEVQGTLTEAFERYGLPDTMLVDNGSPWGKREYHHTALTVWLMRINIGVIHSRPYHPQTLGKDERFHRTLKEELISRNQWRDLIHLQRSFDPWRHTYNFERPHDSLGLDVPADRYRPSLRSLPESLPQIEYAEGISVRKVEDMGKISFHGKSFRIGKAFRGYPVGLQPTDTDGVYDVFFCQHKIKHIDLRND